MPIPPRAKPAPKRRLPALTIREKALRVAVGELGKHEVGLNNHGPAPKKYLAEVGLPEGYPWCDAFVSWCYHKASGRKMPQESAGVIVTLDYAARHGWLTSKPKRGDLVCYDFSGNGVCDDHIGIVERVISSGSSLVLQTVEGNTSSGSGGSQSDGGGVYRRVRTVSRRGVRFIRVPGLVRVSRAPLFLTHWV